MRLLAFICLQESLSQQVAFNIPPSLLGVVSPPSTQKPLPPGVSDCITGPYRVYDKFLNLRSPCFLQLRRCLAPVLDVRLRAPRQWVWVEGTKSHGSSGLGFIRF